MPLSKTPPVVAVTCDNTVPSVIIVSTQGSRELHTRGTPAQTGMTSRAETETEGEKRKQGWVTGLKKKGHSQGQMGLLIDTSGALTLFQDLEKGQNKNHGT